MSATGSLLLLLAHFVAVAAGFTPIGSLPAGKCAKGSTPTLVRTVAVMQGGGSGPGGMKGGEPLDWQRQRKKPTPVWMQIAATGAVVLLATGGLVEEQVEATFRPISEKGGYGGYLNLPKPPGSDYAKELKAAQKARAQQLKEEKIIERTAQFSSDAETSVFPQPPTRS
eukprot:5412887-Pleurochrysis_carterae.AAC.1